MTHASMVNSTSTVSFAFRQHRTVAQDHSISPSSSLQLARDIGPAPTAAIRRGLQSRVWSNDPVASPANPLGVVGTFVRRYLNTREVAMRIVAAVLCFVAGLAWLGLLGVGTAYGCAYAGGDCSAELATFVVGGSLAWGLFVNGGLLLWKTAWNRRAAVSLAIAIVPFVTLTAYAVLLAIGPRAAEWREELFFAFGMRFVVVMEQAAWPLLAVAAAMVIAAFRTEAVRGRKLFRSWPIRVGLVLSSVGWLWAWDSEWRAERISWDMIGSSARYLYVAVNLAVGRDRHGPRQDVLEGPGWEG